MLFIPLFFIPLPNITTVTVSPNSWLNGGSVWLLPLFIQQLKIRETIWIKYSSAKKCRNINQMVVKNVRYSWSVECNIKEEGLHSERRLETATFREVKWRRVRNSLIHSSHIRSNRSGQMSKCERFAQVAHDK